MNNWVKLWFSEIVWINWTINSIFNYDYLYSPSYPEITVRKTTKLLSISNDRFYHELRNEAPSTHIEKIHPPRLLLTDEEELEIINQIEKRQMQNDCLSS